MATPPRKLIIDDVIASLGAISTASSYKLTAASVARQILGPDEIPVDATPWFGAITVGVAKSNYQPGGVIERTLPILVAGAVAIPPSGDQTEDGRGLVCAKILDDLKYALCGTVAISRRGGNAIMTTLVEEWTDEAHEVPVVLESGHMICYAIARAEVRYDELRLHS